jgi:hypothetical protein
MGSPTFPRRQPSAEQLADRGNFIRRWRLEAKVLATVSFFLIWGEWTFGRFAGSLIVSIGLLGLCALSKRTRRLASRLVARHDLRPTQKRIDWALRRDSPQLFSVQPTPIGEEVRAGVNLGSNCEVLARHAPTMAAALGVREVRVRQRRENAGIAELVVVRTETLERPVRPERFLSQYRPDVFSTVPLGVDEDGRDVVIGLVGHHLLIGGEPGAGKSGTLSVVLAAAARDPGCDLWCFDGKLVELAAWRPVATRVVGSYMSAANEALDEIRAEMDRRYERLLKRGRRKVVPGDGERPIVVVIDELAFYVANGDKKAAGLFSEKLRDLVARARAAGIVVVAATQKPSTELIPSALRDNFGYKLAHRCATRETSDTILGSGWAAQGVSAAEIDPKLRGAGFLLGEEGAPKRMRVMQLDDEDIARLVVEAKSLRGIS